MEIKFFGQNITVNRGATTPVIENGETIANISNKNNQLITILFAQKIDFSTAGIYKLAIEKDTEIFIDIQDQKKNIVTGSIHFEAFGIALTQIEPFLDNNQFSFRSKSLEISNYLSQKILKTLFSGTFGNVSLGVYNKDLVLSGFSPSLSKKQVELYTEPIEAIVLDGILKIPVQYRQNLTITHMVLSQNGTKVNMQPQNGMLYISPDVLTMFKQQESTENDSALFFQYQFALINGNLSYDLDPNFKFLGAFWEQKTINDKSAILLLKYSDENGSPIAMTPDASNPRWELRYRDGNSALLNEDGAFPNKEFQKTIRGISIDSVSGTLQTIAFESVDFEKRERQLYGLNKKANTQQELLVSPYWLSLTDNPNKIVKLDNDSPQVIYGLTKGAWLSKSDKAKTNVVLSMEPVYLEDDKSPIIYHLHGLGLEHKQWMLNSQYEEKESRLISDNKDKSVIQSRTFVSDVVLEKLEKSTFEIPATDYHFAATNIYHPKTLKNDASPVFAKIPLQAIAKIEEINEIFRKFNFVPPDQKHVSKFERIYVDRLEKPSELLQTIPIVTRKPSDLERFPLQLQNLQAKIKQTEGEHPVVSGAPLQFIHGKKAGITFESTKLKKADRELPESLLQQIKELQRIWNEGAFMMESNTLAELATDTPLQKLAKNIRIIRHYIDGVDFVQGANDLKKRVQFLGAAYRLQFDTYVGTPLLQEALLEQIKGYLKGNLNAIPGLGQRMRSLNLVIENWKVADLKTAWNKGLADWSNTATTDFAIAETRVLNALFDYVYKQADRELIGTLATFKLNYKKLPDELKIVKDSATKLFEEYQALFEDTATTFETAAKTFTTDIFQGTDPYVLALQELWSAKDSLGFDKITTDQIKARYGSYFDIQSYKKIIVDYDLPIITALEYQLRKKLRTEFDTLVDAIIKQIIETPDKIDQLLATYEEDIVALLLFAEKTVKFLEENKTLIAKLKNLSTPDQVKAALKGLEQDLKKTVYIFISDYIKTHYGHQLDEMAGDANAQIDKLVQLYYDQVRILLSLIDQYELWKTKIINNFNRVTASLKQAITVLTTDKGILLQQLKAYLIQKHNISISFLDLRVAPPQYIVYSKQVSFNIDPKFVEQFNAILTKLHLDKYDLCVLGNSHWDFTFSDQAIYILKLGNDMTVEEILKDINDRNKKPKDKEGPLGDVKKINDYFHEDIKKSNWRGLIILNPIADISKDELIRDLAGKSNIKMKYAAIGGAESTLTGGLDVYARVLEENKAVPATEKDKDDAKFTLIKFDASIKNTQLESGDITFQLDFKNIFGKENEFDKIIIKGIVPKGKNTAGGKNFKFSAQLERPKKFEIKTAFLDELEIRGITAERSDKKSVLSIDGSLSFQKMPEINIFPGQNQIVLKNFRLIVPEQGAGSSTRIGLPRGINIEMSAIEFVFDKPRPINFGFMEILPKGISYYKDFNELQRHDFLRNKIWITKIPDTKPGFTCLNIKLDFGKLTTMGGSGAGKLEMSGILGFTIDKANINGPFFALNSVSGEDINIDLFRFITLYIKKLKIASGKMGQDDVTYIRADDAKIKLLGWSPLGKDGKFSLINVQKKPSDTELLQSPITGFAAIASKDPDGEGNEQSWKIGVLEIFWVFIARNLKFENKNLIELLKDPGENDSEAAEGGALRKLQIYKKDSDDLFNLKFTPDESWLFGASFSIANFLERCTMILHDQHFYGIMLYSKEAWFKAVFGSQKLAMAYMPGKTKEQDRFRIEFGLPALNFLGALESGLVALEYAMNRDFLIDFGFPWRSGNTYLWARTFALRSGIYETRFGFYFEKKTEVKSEPGGTDITLLTIGAGVAIYYGYYIGRKNRFAWAEAGIGITVILAGAVTFKAGKGALPALNSSIYKLEVIGVIGIYAYAEGGIDYWIFSASIRAEVVAALAGTLVYMPTGNSSITFEATLSVKYHASASIKLGFVKKTFKISGQLEYGVSGRVALN